MKYLKLFAALLCVIILAASLSSCTRLFTDDEGNFVGLEKIIAIALGEYQKEDEADTLGGNVAGIFAGDVAGGNTVRIEYIDGKTYYVVTDKDGNETRVEANGNGIFTNVDSSTFTGEIRYEFSTYEAK